MQMCKANIPTRTARATRITKPRLEREKLVEVIAKAARCLERRGDYVHLEELLNEGGLLWSSNRTTRRPIRELAGDLIALAPLASDDNLEATAYGSVMRREEAKGANRDEANAIADRTIARLGGRFAPCGCLAQFADGMCCDKSDLNVASASKEAA